jgi:hypothetical protein
MTKNILKDLFPFYDADVAKDLLSEEELNTWKEGFQDPIFSRLLKTILYEISNLNESDLSEHAPELKFDSLINPQAMFKMMGDFICPNLPPFTEAELSALSEEEMEASEKAFAQAMTLRDKFSIDGANKDKMMEIFQNLMASKN